MPGTMVGNMLEYVDMSTCISWNVMVGITRSTLIYLLFSKIYEYYHAFSVWNFCLYFCSLSLNQKPSQWESMLWVRLKFHFGTHVWYFSWSPREEHDGHGKTVWEKPQNIGHLYIIHGHINYYAANLRAKALLDALAKKHHVPCGSAPPGSCGNLAQRSGCSTLPATHDDS